MFVENKYRLWYFSIIDKAKSRKIEGYKEVHHIIPKSLGGDNDKNNLVELTAREHFICHVLLTKITAGKNKKSMIFALNALSNLSNAYQNRYKSRLYEMSRKMFSIEQSISMTGKGNPMFGKRHTEEARIKMSIFHKGKIPWNLGQQLTEDHRQKISNSNSGENNFMFGKTHTEESKKKISEKNKGHSHNKGIPKTQEQKRKISEKLKGKIFTEEHKQKLKNVPKILCENCNSLTSPSMYKRWHGINCKSKI
jgi:hypothetical protein